MGWEKREAGRAVRLSVKSDLDGIREGRQKGERKERREERKERGREEGKDGWLDGSLLPSPLGSPLAKITQSERPASPRRGTALAPLRHSVVGYERGSGANIMVDFRAQYLVPLHTVQAEI